MIRRVLLSAALFTLLPLLGSTSAQASSILPLQRTDLERLSRNQLIQELQRMSAVASAREDCDDDWRDLPGSTTCDEFRATGSTCRNDVFYTVYTRTCRVYDGCVVLRSSYEETDERSSGNRCF